MKDLVIAVTHQYRHSGALFAELYRYNELSLIRSPASAICTKGVPIDI